jgi:uncharacterized membrane protein YeaQ/YmgE (transglycosylase-associated protein family)
MEVLSWIFVGALAGSIARAVMPGPPAGGMHVAILIGVIGAVLAGSAGYLLLDASTSFTFLALGWALNGSLYLLFAYRCIAMRGADTIRRGDPSKKTSAEQICVTMTVVGAPPLRWLGLCGLRSATRSCLNSFSKAFKLVQPSCKKRI